MKQMKDERCMVRRQVNMNTNKQNKTFVVCLGRSSGWPGASSGWPGVRFVSGSVFGLTRCSFCFWVGFLADPAVLYLFVVVYCLFLIFVCCLRFLFMFHMCMFNGCYVYSYFHHIGHWVGPWADPVFGLLIWWWYADMMIWWYDDMMIWWYDDMMIWWYDDMRWCYDMMIWWYDDIMIWDDMRWYYDMMIWDDVMIWWYDEKWWNDMRKWWNDDTMMIYDGDQMLYRFSRFWSGIS